MRFRAPLYVLLFSFLCLTIHELGHVLAGVWFGGEVREFVLISVVPHVRLSGAFSAVEESWIALAGSGSELLLFGAAALAGRRLAVEVTGVFACVELVGWTAAALAYPGGPRDNDACDFLAQSGVSAWWVVAVCAALGLAVWAVWRMRASAPKQRSWQGRTGTVPVDGIGEEICYVEMFAGSAVRFADGRAVPGHGASAGAES